MNIAIIHSRLNSKGGTQRKVLACANAMQKLGHCVTVYAMSYDKAKCYPAMLATLTVVPLPGYNDKAQKSRIPYFSFLNYFFYSRKENTAARALALLIDPQTNILNPYDRLSYRTAVYFKKNVSNIPSVAIMDDIYTKLWSSWRKAQFDKKFFLPWKRRVFYKLIDWYETKKFILPHDRIVVLDKRTKQWVKEYFKKDAVIVRNGLAIDDFPYTSRVDPSYKRMRLLSTGIFFLHRRYEDIISALPMLRERGIDAELSIVGNYGVGEYYQYFLMLKKLAEEKKVSDRVFFLGNVSDGELLSHYATHDIYVSANHLQSWGLAVFEAMASGMPVVVSKTAGAADVLEDRRHALLIPAKSPEKIADAVETLVRDQTLYKQLSGAGRKFVENNITWEKTANDLISIFSQLCQKKTQFSL